MYSPQELADRAAIGDVVTRLAYTQDDKDFPALVALFSDEIDFDWSGEESEGPERMTRAEFETLARSVLTGFTATQHTTSNVLTTLEGDEATCRVTVGAYHHVPTEPGVDDHYTARNNWHLRLRRTDDGWVITSWAIVSVAPSDGYRGVYQLAQDRAAEA